MRSSICGKVLLAGACMMNGFWGFAQQVQRSKEPLHPSYDVAVVYHSARSSEVGGDIFWMQGGSVQMQMKLKRRLGLVADVTGLHTAKINSTNIGLDMVSATFGPRYTWTPNRYHVELFGEALGGTTKAFNSLFQAPVPVVGGAKNNAVCMTMQLGGGVNIPVRHHLSVRALQADWLRTELPNNASNVQNNLRLGAGLIYRFK